MAYDRVEPIIADCQPNIKYNIEIYLWFVEKTQVFSHEWIPPERSSFLWSPIYSRALPASLFQARVAKCLKRVILIVPIKFLILDIIESQKIEI